LALVSEISTVTSLAPPTVTMLVSNSTCLTSERSGSSMTTTWLTAEATSQLCSVSNGRGAARKRH